MADQIWSWALTIVGATCFYLAGGLNGRKVWWAWYIGLFAQALWLTYALLDLEHRVGFLVGVALYGYVYVRNCVNWTREHRAERRAAAQRSRMIRTIAEALDVPIELIDRPWHERCRFVWSPDGGATLVPCRGSAGHGMHRPDGGRWPMTPPYVAAGLEHLSTSGRWLEEGEEL